MHHSDFIKIIASVYKPKKYIELGLYEGETLTKVLPYVQEKGIGVDMVLSQSVKNINHPKLIKFEGKTDSFFAQQSIDEKFDLIFIDADHCFQSVLKDFKNSLNLLTRDGLIILHDTNPIDNKYFDKGYCGDSYKIVPVIENEYKDILNIFTMPLTEAGLSIITRKNSTRTIIRNEHL